MNHSDTLIYLLGLNSHASYNRIQVLYRIVIIFNNRLNLVLDGLAFCLRLGLYCLCGRCVRRLILGNGNRRLRSRFLSKNTVCHRHSHCKAHRRHGSKYGSCQNKNHTPFCHLPSGSCRTNHLFTDKPPVFLLFLFPSRITYFRHIKTSLLRVLPFRQTSPF